MKNKPFLSLLLVTISLQIFAQEKNVNAASKLVGIDGKTAEARTLIKQAMEDSVTCNEARTWVVAGDIESAYFDTEYHKLSINPNDKRVDKSAMGQALIDAYHYYTKALPLDTIINRKGKVKTKYSKEIQKKLKGLALDRQYIWAASHFSQIKKRYPEAYEAFRINADLLGLQIFASDKVIASIPDSVRGHSYFNAGISAWSGGQPLKGAEMFCKARCHNFRKKEVFSYEIACYQALAQQDTALIAAAEKGMIEAAKAGYETFGTDIPLYLHIYIRGLCSDNRWKEATDLLNKEIEKSPENGILYRHRAFVYDQMKEDNKSVEDYIKAAQLSNDFETQLEAGRKIAMVGTKRIQEISIDAPDAKERRLKIITDYLQPALTFAQKAKSLNSDNPDTDIIIENITYCIESNSF